MQEIRDYLRINNIKDKERPWLPYITLRMKDNINENTYNIEMKKFISFEAKVEYIYMYNKNMELIKEYNIIE